MLTTSPRSHVPAVRETHLLATSVCVLVINACMLIISASSLVISTCMLAIIESDRNKYTRKAFAIDICCGCKRLTTYRRSPIDSYTVTDRTHNTPPRSVHSPSHRRPRVSGVCRRPGETCGRSPNVLQCFHSTMWPLALTGLITCCGCKRLTTYRRSPIDSYTVTDRTHNNIYTILVQPFPFRA